MNKKHYEIKWETRKVIVTRAFVEKASQLGTDEFKTMMELQQLGMDIVVKGAPKRKGVHRATYNQMRAYISCLEDADRYLAEFEQTRIASLEKPNPYLHVVEWYEKTFPNHNAKPEYDENHYIINYADAA